MPISVKTYFVITKNLDIRIMEDKATVNIRVGKVLREYIVATRGTDLLVPAKGSMLWGLMKQHLTTYRHGDKGIPDGLQDEYIRIALRNTHSAFCYNIPSRKKMHINTLYRTHLTPAGHTAIRNFLNMEFKKTYRSYMHGCLANNPDMKIVEAIEEFCTDHGITPDKVITIEMLRKDWYRHCRKSEEKQRFSLEI